MVTYTVRCGIKSKKYSLNKKYIYWNRCPISLLVMNSRVYLNVIPFHEFMKKDKA
jgi:hypothetical protein